MHVFDNSAGRRTARRASLIGLATAGVGLMVLSACTSRTMGIPNSPAAAGGTLSTNASASSSQPSGPAVITATPLGRHISPATPVQVAIQNGKLTSVSMVNPEGKHVTGAISADGSSWQNTEVLGYSRTYRITAQGVGDDGTPITKTARVTTLTPGNMTMPYIEDIYGHYVQNHGTYGIGMIVRVHFDEHVNEAKAERTLQVTTTPSVTGGWYWQDDQDVYWRPENFYAPGTQVTISANVYGRAVGNGLYGQADQSVSFTIGARHVSIANAKTHMVKVYFNGRLVRRMPTSMGRGGVVQGTNGPIYLWTMPGIYTVINHENPAIMSSDSYGLPANSPIGYAPEAVYWSTKISVDGIYLHELDATVWAQGHENVSHGCLNLNLQNARWYYKHSLIGDVVKVRHSGGPEISFNQGGEWSVPWSTWLKGSALYH